MGAPPGIAGSVPMTPFRIFINYRRSDSGGYAGRIYDAVGTASARPLINDLRPREAPPESSSAALG